MQRVDIYFTKIAEYSRKLEIVMALLEDLLIHSGDS